VITLAFDTATAATVVGMLGEQGESLEARHEPEEGERPGHGTRLLGLVEQVLGEAGRELADVGLIAVGIGPGSFTGLRIGVSTARALSQALGAQLAGVGTLRALAAAAQEAEESKRTVLAVLDARRGEAYAAAYAGSRVLLEPCALVPEALAAAAARLGDADGASPLAVGEGALRFRRHLEAAGAAIPDDASPLHRVSARQLCRLATEADVTGEAVVPDYVRPPDARPQPDRKPHTSK
jgi:tRNA threonylcarbamoyladenosine biosynthesis protein TsaB